MSLNNIVIKKLILEFNLKSKDDLFEKLQNLDTTNIEYKSLLQNFAEFSRELSNIENDKILLQNPALEKLNDGWIESGLKAMGKIFGYADGIAQGIYDTNN